MILKKVHIVEYIALINLQFPNAYNFANERDEDMFIGLWYEGLKVYPKELCDIAVRNAILKAEFVPKIATIVKEAESLLEAQGSSDSELWSELVCALTEIRSELPYMNDRYDTVVHDNTGLTTAGETRKLVAHVYNTLDPKLKEYCGSMRSFMDLAQIDEADLQFEKGRFLKQLPVLSERIKTKQNTPPQLANLINGLIGDNTNKMIGAKNG